MLSFRINDADANEVRRWAEALGVDRSELLREAIRRHLALLSTETDLEAWESMPLTPGERSLMDSQDWGPAEDWTDWADATG